MNNEETIPYEEIIRYIKKRIQDWEAIIAEYTDKTDQASENIKWFYNGKISAYQSLLILYGDDEDE